MENFGRLLSEIYSKFCHNWTCQFGMIKGQDGDEI